GAATSPKPLGGNIPKELLIVLAIVDQWASCSLNTRTTRSPRRSPGPERIASGRTLGGHMEVTVEHLGGVQFEIKARQHRIACDQPVENGGFDEGMTPPELLLASLGSCSGFYTALYLKKHQLPTEGTILRISAEKTMNPPRMNDFRIQLEIPRN